MRSFGSGLAGLACMGSSSAEVLSGLGPNVFPSHNGDPTHTVGTKKPVGPVGYGVYSSFLTLINKER
jgi:hypothetical protein